MKKFQVKIPKCHCLYRLEPIEKLKIFFGLPAREITNQYAAKKISQMERNARSLLVTKRGYDQLRRDFCYSDFHWKNNLVRFALMLTIIRLALIIYFDSNESVDLILGNPFYKQPIGFILISFTELFLVVLVILREYALYLEDSGSLLNLQVLKTIQDHGFNADLLYLTPKQNDNFSLSFNLIATNWTHLLELTKILAPIFLFILRFINPHFHQNLWIFLANLLWLPTEFIAARFIFTGLLNTSSHLIILNLLYLANLNSLLEIVTNLTKKKVINEQEVIKLHKMTIICFNDCQFVFDKLKYMFFYLFVLVSFLADALIFLSIRLVLPDALKYSLFLIGLVSLFIISLVTYSGGSYGDLLSLYQGLLVKVFPHFKVKLEYKLKMQEVVYRATSEVTLPSIGDFCIVRKQLFVIYILENISTIMLLICTINT